MPVDLKRLAETLGVRPLDNPPHHQPVPAGTYLEGGETPPPGSDPPAGHPNPAPGDAEEVGATPPPRSSLLTRLAIAGVALGWSPLTLENWRRWGETARLEDLAGVVAAAEDRAAKLPDPEERRKRLKDLWTRRLLEVARWRGFPPERLQRAEEWARGATLEEVVRVVLLLEGEREG